MTYILLLLASGLAYANEPEAEPKVVYKQKTEIDFEGVEIEGELVKPQGALLLNRRAARFNPMVWVRTDFDDEIDKTVEEVK